MTRPLQSTISARIIDQIRRRNIGMGVQSEVNVGTSPEVREHYGALNATADYRLDRLVCFHIIGNLEIMHD